MPKSTRMFVRLAAILMGVTTTVIVHSNLPCEAAEPPTIMNAKNSVAKKTAANAVTGPKSVDLRPNLEKWKLDARLQGTRVTCSVFVVTEALEFALAAKQRRGTRLSVEYLNWAANKAANSADDGGFFSEIWKGFETYGICPEAEMPYRDRFDPALAPEEKTIAQAKKLSSLGLKLHWIKEWDADKGVSEKQLAEIKKTLARGWPVGGGFLWPKSKKLENNALMVVPRSEVYDGHSVLLVGYRDDQRQPGGGVFLFRNTAGDSRDSLMPYDYALNFMNDAVWISGAGDAPAKPPKEVKKSAFRPAR